MQRLYWGASCMLQDAGGWLSLLELELRLAAAGLWPSGAHYALSLPAAPLITLLTAPPARGQFVVLYDYVTYAPAPEPSWSELQAAAAALQRLCNAVVERLRACPEGHLSLWALGDALCQHSWWPPAVGAHALNLPAGLTLQQAVTTDQQQRMALFIIGLSLIHI